MRRIIVGINQSIWDISMQEYGHLDGIKQLMIDNPTKCNFESSIAPGTELIISKEPINKSIFDYFIKKRVKPATAVEEVYEPNDWILADGTWNDNGFWVDNALWID